MKKIILLLVVVGLLVPAGAMAATEFSLGGFVKLDAFWDSAQVTKNMITAVARNNDLNAHHGNLRFTAQGSRFNFTIKGPKVFGALVTGFLEMDFDSVQNVQNTSSNSYVPRLRHAMFRLNWPETELLFGQYWSMFCENYPESAQDGPFMFHGQPTARLPQIRVTQKFAGAWTTALLIGDPNMLDGNITAVQANYSAVVSNSGTASETPQVQGKVEFQQDLWGKAAFYGKPMPFTAKVIAGWQRVVARNNYQAANNFFTWGENTYGTTTAVLRMKDHTYLDPWMVQGYLFFPIIPTHSANLAGTASLSTQWYIGQGLQAFGEGTGAQSSFFRFSGVDIFGRRYWDLELMPQYGGYVQAQYYFNNQWFLNLSWGMSKVFGLPQDRSGGAVFAGAANNPQGYVYATNADQYKMWQEFDICLWYRPIQAIKFGLQYAYSRVDWLQRTGSAAAPLAYIAAPTNVTSLGENHRVEFVGFFFF